MELGRAEEEVVAEVAVGRHREVHRLGPALQLHEVARADICLLRQGGAATSAALGRLCAGCQSQGLVFELVFLERNQL